MKGQIKVIGLYIYDHILLDSGAVRRRGFLLCFMITQKLLFGLLSNLFHVCQLIRVRLYCKSLKCSRPLIFANFANGLNSQK